MPMLEILPGDGAQLLLVCAATFLAGLIMLVPLMSGSLLGAWLFPKASPRAYRNLALATISAAAVVSPIL